MKLTQEEKRIRIAEACGWKRHPEDKWIISAPGDYPHSVQPLHTIPDYFNSLDAMHEAEHSLDYKQAMEYERRLQVKCWHTDGEINDGVLALIRATAAQRAEAFGLTLNLWQPGE